MWLINATSLKLEPFTSTDKVPYAILSHTWGEEEVSFQDLQNLQHASQKLGFEKIRMTCELARDEGLRYVWIDTCCIDKTNHAELAEAINSMFEWYTQSFVCYAYLVDLAPPKVRPGNPLDARHCRWFTRGWTLQELIAPSRLELLDREWVSWGDKITILDALSEITGIQKDALFGPNVFKYSAAQKMSWAATRNTTRVEDIAYSLMGLFDVNMPLIYGEGPKAFFRLQEEIIKQTNDWSVFAWTTESNAMSIYKDGLSYRGLLATSPAEFSHCSNIHLMHPTFRANHECTITNRGFRIEAVLGQKSQSFLLNLYCFDETFQRQGRLYHEWIGVYLTKTQTGFVRSRPKELFYSGRDEWHPGEWTRTHIPRHVTFLESEQMKLQYTTIVGIVRLMHRPFRVLAVGPTNLWDSSRGIFLLGGGMLRFTGYFHLRTISQPEFEFIIVCHLSRPQVESQKWQSFCSILTESDVKWPFILDLLARKMPVADSNQLDRLHYCMVNELSSSTDSGRFEDSSKQLCVNISINVGQDESLKDVVPVFSPWSTSMHSLDIQFEPEDSSEISAP